MHQSLRKRNKPLNTAPEHGFTQLLEAELEEDAEVEKWEQTWISVSVAINK